MKTLLKSLAVAASLALAPVAASAAITIIDLDNDSTNTVPGALTLAFSPPTTPGMFDTTSSFYNFSGSVSAGDTSTFNTEITTTESFVLTFGNLVAPEQYAKAEVTVGAMTIDLLTQGNTFMFTPVSSPFTLSGDFENNSGAPATYDFQISVVPLPAAGLLLLTALGGAAAAYRRRKT